MKKRGTSILRYFLPVLFIAYMGAISLFTHSHVVNGVTIVHSHPYTDNGQHSHTASQFQLIYMLSHVQIADGAVSFLSLTLCLVLLCCFLAAFCNNHSHLSFRGVVSLRAPPIRR